MKEMNTNKQQGYILINLTEDGDHYFTQFENSAQLHKILDEMTNEGTLPSDFLNSTEIEQNLSCQNGYILIKGEVIVPKAITEVIKMSAV